MLHDYSLHGSVEFMPAVKLCKQIFEKLSGDVEGFPCALT